MATRRDAREWAVQLLFQLDVNPSDTLNEVFETFWSDKESDARSRKFAEGIVRGVVQNREQIDETIRAVAEHWDLKRMGVLDRNVIRMGIYEILYVPDVPPAVSINEAVDIAKYFSSYESGRFVNGILDRVRKNIKRTARK